MISAIDLIRLKNSEFIRFCKDLLTFVKKEETVVVSVKPKLDVMDAGVSELDGMFKQGTSNPMTKIVEALDMRRDRAINGIIAVVKAFTYHFDAAIVAAALTLEKNLAVYGAGIARESYPSETTTLEKIVNDWENKPELKAAVVTLNLTAWVAEMKAANKEFAETYLERTEVYGSASPENLRSKRIEVMGAYYELRKHLESYAVVQKSAVYDKLFQNINALIDQYNLIITRRKGGSPEETDNPSEE